MRKLSKKRIVITVAICWLVSYCLILIFNTSIEYVEFGGLVGFDYKAIVLRNGDFEFKKNGNIISKGHLGNTERLALIMPSIIIAIPTVVIDFIDKKLNSNQADMIYCATIIHTDLMDFTSFSDVTIGKINKYQKKFMLKIK